MILRPVINMGVAFAVLLSTLAPLSGPAFAQSDLADEAKRKVNIAGRQRMLSQRMSKAACFILTGVDSEGHQGMLSDAYNQFVAAQDTLRFGNANIGLNAEDKPTVLISFGLVDEAWIKYAPAVEAVIAEGTTDAAQMATLNVLGLEVLGIMNSTVGDMASAYGADLEDLPMILAITIDLAGRQRMFTQKISKEFCLIDAGIDVAENTAKLAETLNFFNLTLTSLIEGFPGAIVPAPNAEILEKLGEVQSLWVEPGAILAAVAGGAPITAEARLVIAKDVELVLAAMNEAVGMYETVK